MSIKITKTIWWRESCLEPFCPKMMQLDLIIKHLSYLDLNRSRNTFNEVFSI